MNKKSFILILLMFLTCTSVSVFAENSCILREGTTYSRIKFVSDDERIVKIVETDLFSPDVEDKKVLKSMLDTDKKYFNNLEGHKFNYTIGEVDKDLVKAELEIDVVEIGEKEALKKYNLPEETIIDGKYDVEKIMGLYSQNPLIECK